MHNTPSTIKNQFTFVSNRPFNDYRYFTNNSPHSSNNNPANSSNNNSNNIPINSSGNNTDNSGPRTQILTIMFLDLADYTKMISNLSSARINTLHDLFDGLVLARIAPHHGTVVKKIGDAFLIYFKQASDSLLCSLSLQVAFHNHRHTQSSLNRPLHIRIALHTGEVLLRKGDIYGDTVNTASRIEGLAQKDHIIASLSTIQSLPYPASSDFHIRFIGNHSFRGLASPLPLYQIFTLSQYKHHQRILFFRTIRRFLRRTLLFSLWLITMISLVILFYYLLSNSPLALLFHN